LQEREDAGVEGSCREAEPQVMASIEPRILLAPELPLVPVLFIDSSSCDGRHYFNLSLTKQKVHFRFPGANFFVLNENSEKLFTEKHQLDNLLDLLRQPLSSVMNPKFSKE